MGIGNANKKEFFLIKVKKISLSKDVYFGKISNFIKQNLDIKRNLDH